MSENTYTWTRRYINDLWAENDLDRFRHLTDWKKYPESYKSYIPENMQEQYYEKDEEKK